MDDDIEIRIGFSRSRSGYKKWFANFIRYGESFEQLVLHKRWSILPYSHIYLTWHSNTAQTYIVYHASGTMLHFLNRKFFDKVAITSHEYQFKIKRSEYKQLIGFCMSNAGADYGTQQLVGIAWVKINRLFGVKIKNPYGDGRRSQVCSEMVGYFMEHCLGWDVGIDLDVASPFDIDMYLASKNIERVDV